MARSCIAILLFAFFLPPGVLAQTSPHADCPMAQAHGMDPASADGAADVAANQEMGQATFAAVAEMLRVLEADPSVDWQAVRLDRLREHLIDMDRVMAAAQVEVTDLDDGFRARVTSTDPRTADAIGRMVPAHGHMMDGHLGWRVTVEAVDDAADRGVWLEVRSSDAAEAVKLRALGFAGFMVTGDHHRPHHLAMTLGGSLPPHHGR